ncbi:MAG TPA: 4-(cytidine 5'-diphospho)-2-C-methyl-D-erythritol kinase [Planctomycetaceae bacterium]|nr:4-(cytidine 5'-diphospho)-2-C-methyl-D-erythritol kinase [Planctomycetaceae bacterium]
MRIWRVGKAVVAAAPAKINLFLEILARRDDGFHELETVMVAVNLYDTIELTATDDGELHLECRVPPARQARGLQDGSSRLWADLPSGGENLAVRALRLLQQASSTRQGASLRLTKRIPLQAGLGGGSSDAAAALLAANQLWNLHWTRERLLPLAAELGSDVPFFLTGGAAVCRGRGERVEPIAGVASMPLVIAHPGTGLSTARVYAACHVPSRPLSARDAIAAVRRGDRCARARAMANRLSEPARRISEEIAALGADFRRLLGQGYQMTGSGAAYFGVCRSLRQARRAARWLRGRGWPFAVAATTVA